MRMSAAFRPLKGDIVPECIFCLIVAGSAPSWKVHETTSAYAFFVKDPVNAYHTLVIPKRHYSNIFDIPAQELGDVIATLKQVVDMYHAKLGIQNVQIVNSSGAEAQQDVFHLHFHIVPRHSGDGQDIQWSTHPELRSQFDALLARLQ
jgi:histidine triad (HIT) family protein